MAFTTYLDNALLNQVFGGSAMAVTANLYVGLSTSAPNADGTGITEPSGGAYARVGVANNTTNFPGATNGNKSNGTVITFPAATASWGTLSHFVIYDAASAGNIIATGQLAAAKAIGSGDTASFAAGALTVSLT